VRVTQTAPTGFAEGQADFSHAPTRAPEVPAFSPATLATARAVAQDITDPGLRAALERLGGHVLAAAPKKEG
jgi:hypothetical protein